MCLRACHATCVYKLNPCTVHHVILRIYIYNTHILDMHHMLHAPICAYRSLQPPGRVGRQTDMHSVSQIDQTTYLLSSSSQLSGQSALKLRNFFFSLSLSLSLMLLLPPPPFLFRAAPGRMRTNVDESKLHIHTHPSHLHRPPHVAQVAYRPRTRTRTTHQT